MTEKQDMGVVTQADIDAAQGYIDAFNRDGINSKHKLAQHFAAHRLASQADQGEMNWKAEWEAASSENIRLRAALNQICDLGCCGGKGLLQKAIDIAVTAVTATHPQPSQKGEGDE